MQITMSVREWTLMMGALADRISKLELDLKDLRAFGDKSDAEQTERQLVDLIVLKSKVENA